MRDLAPAIALLTVAEDLVYTEARLFAWTDTKPLAVSITNLLTQVDAAQAAHVGHLRSIARADASAAGARAEVELFCGDLQKKLLALVAQDRQAPLFRTYFAEAASTIQTMDEASLRTWLDGAATALAASADKDLKAQGVIAKNLLAKWNEAERAQAAAGTANSQHDASARQPLREAVNAGRRDVHADLTKLGTKHKRSKRWVESFFRSARASKPDPNPAA